MGIIVEDEVSLADLDEAMIHIHKLLLDPKTNARRRALLLSSLDDLLDAKLEMAALDKAGKVVIR
jgi:hypothetical protein